MNYQAVDSKRKVSIRNSTLIILGFATAFFPRFFSSFGLPSVINFAHFGIVPVVVGLTLFTTRIRDRKQLAIIGEISLGLVIFLSCTLASALLNNAGIVNVFLDFMLKAEPFLLLLAMMSLPAEGKALQTLRRWLLGFVVLNLALAIIQSVLLPIGLYPKPQGGTIQDNITGVFGGGGGSAGNYVSCTISVYFALYFFHVFKTAPLWLRLAGLLAALYQVQVSDSKQVFLALLGGGLILVLTKTKRPARLLLYAIAAILVLSALYWGIQNLEFFAAYRNWTDRIELYGPNGEGTQTKLAAFRIVPTYYHSPLNWLFGLGPGHSVSRLGGWILRDYANLLLPLGATVHPASAAVFKVVNDGWVAQESTVFFPLFTWAGIWGDLGFLGLGSYLYLCYIVWRRICVDDYCKFLVLSTVAFGFILTQMEEPGHMLTVACLLGLRGHEIHLEQKLKQYQKALAFTPVAQIQDEQERS